MTEKETIKVKSVYCERMGDPVVQQILNRSFPVKTGYWISRVIEKIRQEAKAYTDHRNKLIEKHTDTEKQKEAEEKGTAPPGQVLLKDVQAFQRDLVELQEIEINLGMNKVKVDLDELEKWFGEHPITIGEMEFLLPFFDIDDK